METLPKRNFTLNTTISEQKEIIEGICALGGAIYICKATDEEKAKMKSLLEMIDKVAQQNWKQILDQVKADRVGTKID